MDGWRIVRPELTASEQQLVSAAVSRALTEDDDSALNLSAAPAAAIGDLKELFCKNWATVKAVLQFLSGQLPAWLRPIVAIIIRIGDSIHGAICP
jgi:hypothetical protein